MRSAFTEKKPDGFNLMFNGLNHIPPSHDYLLLLLLLLLMMIIMMMMIMMMILMMMMIMG